MSVIELALTILAVAALATAFFGIGAGVFMLYQKYKTQKIVMGSIKEILKEGGPEALNNHFKKTWGDLDGRK